MKEDIFNIELNSSICCDLCGEIFKIEFDCPLCNTYAEVKEYFELAEGGHVDYITCCNCDAKFELLQGVWLLDIAVVKHINY